MNDEQRLETVMTMVANAVTLMTASMSGAVGEIAGGLAAGMEAIGQALGGEGAAKPGEGIGKEVSKNVSAMVRDMVVQTHAETLGQMSRIMASLTPEQKKEVFQDIRHESYDEALRAVEKADFGLPKLTEKMPAEELARYLAFQDDPRLGETIQKILSVKQPRVFEAMKAAEEDEERKRKAQEPPPKPAPKKITKLPATYLFAPGAEAAIVLSSKKPLWIKWESKLDAEETGKVQNYGIQVRDDSGGSTSTLDGSHHARPKKGRINVTLKNCESFPIPVAISTEPDKD